MDFTGGDVAIRDSEVNDCQWFSIDDAIKMIAG